MMKIVNFKIRNEKNIVGKDIFQEEIKCNKIINDINFESKLRGINFMKHIKTNWDYSKLAKNYDHRAEYDSSIVKKNSQLFKM